MEQRAVNTPPSSRKTLRGELGPAWPVLVVVAFLIGLPCGLVSVYTGNVHTFDTPWPSLILSAPACLLGSWIFGGSLSYVAFVIVGTGALYALYTCSLICYPMRWSVPGVIAIHLFSALLWWI